MSHLLQIFTLQYTLAVHILSLKTFVQAQMFECTQYSIKCFMYIVGADICTFHYTNLNYFTI